jgi:hypothetical protein
LFVLRSRAENGVGLPLSRLFLLNFLDIFNIVNRYDCFLYRAHSGKALRGDHDAGTLAAAFRCRLA